MFSESSYSNLKFGMKQPKISQKFAEQWLPKPKISGPADDRRPDFFHTVYYFKAVVLPQLRSIKRKNFVKLKET